MTRALRLHRRHTRDELAEQVQALRDDPDAQQAGALHLLTPKARRLHDDLLLAFYWHDAPRGNTKTGRTSDKVVVT